MAYTYVTGDGWTVLVTTEPAGSEAVAVLDNAVRQIKLFIADETNGLGKLLGSTGEVRTLVVGTALPTPSATDRYWFLSTSLNGIYYCNGTTVYPLMPTGGAVAGKVLTSAGAGVLPVWTQALPSRGAVECHTALTPGSTNAQMTLVGSSLPTGTSISSGRLRVTTGYTVLLRGMVHGASNFTGEFSLYNFTSSATLQVGNGPSYSTNSPCIFGAFDFLLSNATGANLDIELRYTLHASSTAHAASSTYPNARLVVEVHPN